MGTHVDNFWIFALISKCDALSLSSIACLLFLSWFLISLAFWAYPGGPAWGKYRFLTPSSSSSSSKPIPGPRGFPLIGSMKLMTDLAHHRIAAAAHACTAKRLMAFSLGHTRVIVTCNPNVAKDILNSSVFADRPIKESAYSLMFNRAIGFAPYGLYWRTLRRIAATHLFCPKQIKASEPQRAQIAAQMAAIFRAKIDPFPVRDVLKQASLSTMMCSVFGRKYQLHSSTNVDEEEEVHELRALVDEGYNLLGTFNYSDHLPFLADFDPQNIRLRCSHLVPKVNRFLKRIIAEHRAPPTTPEISPDFVHVLLSLQGPDKLSDSDIIAVLWEMIFRGTDTVAVLIEWILARMVLHPNVQSRVHDELDRVVGRSRVVAESDITAIEYLPAVVKEVLRLHPPGPLLSWARLAITDTTVDGYHVPAGTTAMVNMWAITRDPDVWSDPLEFKPDRFMGMGAEAADTSVFGSDLRLAPFGSGRRVCPGKALGLTTVTFWVASLLHEFEWEPLDGNGVDLSEVLKLSCEMEKPLTVKVRPRRTPSSP